MNTITRKLVGYSFVGLLPLLTSCAKSTEGKDPPKAGSQTMAAPVLVAKAAQKDVPVHLQAFGNAEAYSTVVIKSQITGQITKVHFQEGQHIKKDDLLFTIDPRPQQAALDQAQAKLVENQAKLKFAQNESLRYENLARTGSAARQKFEQAKSVSDAFEATVKADLAAIENAKLQLEYCSIRCPIDGVTGNLLVHGGNIVKADDVDLVTVNQVSPIYVTFCVPQQHLQDIRQFVATEKVKVLAASSKDPNRPAEGTLSFINNAVDATTGTIMLKATFPNKDHRLWPGEFVRVTVLLTTQPNAVVVPSRAIQTGQNGSFVFVVKSDMTVENKPVVTDRMVGEETVIRTGVTPGQTVVIDGQLRLTPGGKVQIKTSLTDELENK